jgi:regulatory protein
MIITALRKKGSDVIVVLDDGTFLSLDYRIVIDYRLRKAGKLDEEKILLLKENHSLLKIRDSAFRFLARRLHSTAELNNKLLKKKYPTELVEKVLIDLRDKNYLNDDEFTKAFIAERIKSKRIGTNRLWAELFKRGIDRKNAQKYLDAVDRDIYLDNALIVASKKLLALKRKETDSRKISSKLFFFLMSKGYESDVARSVLNNLKLEIED